MAVTWPSPGDFPTLERRKKREKLQRWTKDETAQMRSERLNLEFGAWAQKLRVGSEAALRSILDAVSGEEFAAWYESKTGRDAAPFVVGLQESILSVAGMCRAKDMWLDVLRERIASIDAIGIVDRGWFRSLWSEELQQATGKSRRRILMRLATPEWAKPAAMLELYTLRDELIMTTGVAHHVDHIVPIQHPLVCGLNCEANLRVVTATVNLRKSNQFVTG